MGSKQKRTRVAEATVAHRSTMDRLLDKKLQPQLARAFRQEQKALRALLAGQFAGKTQATVGHTHVKQVEAILAARLPRLGRALAAQLVDQTRETQAEAVRSLARFMGALKPEGSQLDDHTVAERLMRKGRGKHKDLRRQHTEKLSAKILYESSQALKNLDPKMQVKDLIDHVHATIEKQWWQVERTARTETSRAFNETQDYAFDALAEEFPGLYKRWTELVNDITGAPLDDRVAQDSLLLHGQVAKPGGLFHMPSSPYTPAMMIGKAWEAPPNRPNDRAVLTPWHVGCGVPAWLMRGGERVNLK